MLFCPNNFQQPYNEDANLRKKTKQLSVNKIDPFYII